MLHKVGLDHLRDRLDETERWDQILSGGEQQRVAFARTLIHKPDWIFMDEATSALDEAGQENVMKLLIEELPETSIVSIGHRPGLELFHTRELTLVPGEQGARLRDTGGRQQRSLRDVYRRMSVASRAHPPHAGLLGRTLTRQHSSSRGKRSAKLTHAPGRYSTSWKPIATRSGVRAATPTKVARCSQARVGSAVSKCGAVRKW